jgi:ABC-type branched-subunit amino acid transport system substrate-binding protein
VGAARWFAEEFPDAVSNAAIFHGTPQVTVRAAENLIEARESVGWVFSYRQPIAPLESNYTPHALEMQSRDIQAFAFVADVNNIVRLQKALGQLGYSVQVPDVSTQGYTPDYLEAVGADGEGSYVPLTHALFEEADEIPALAEYIEWLEKVAPDAEPSSNGLSAWVRAKLFVEAAEAVGEDLTREKLVAELESITDWDADGLIPPDDIGEPVPATACFLVAQVKDGGYVRAFPESGFHCSPDDVYKYKAGG